MTEEVKHMEQGLEFDQVTKTPENVTCDWLSNADEIKPCPFCGVRPMLKEWEVGGIKQIKIICDGDFCHVHPSIFGNKETMLKEWNTRSAPKMKEVDLWSMKLNKNDDIDWLAYNQAIDDIKSRYLKLYTEEI